MGTLSHLKIAALATSIALAMVSTSAMAAAPTATQLPGLGVASAGTGGGYGAPVVTNGATAGSQNIAITGNTVINWGVTGGTINASQPGGFNIGSAASETFTGGSVLNVDVSGNASQIFGALSSTGGNLYVANANGIIVGATATISSTAGDVGLIANTHGTVAFDGTASNTSIEFQGSGGNVTVAKGAGISGANVLVSGGSVVNVDLSAFTGALTLNAGVKNSASTLVSDNTAAVLTTTGDYGAAFAGFASAGNASTAGTVALSGGSTRVDGILTNTGTLTLGSNSLIITIQPGPASALFFPVSAFSITGSLVNSGKVNVNGDVTVGGLINSGVLDGGNGNYSLTTLAGGIKNSGEMTNLGQVTSNGAFTNDGQVAASSVQVVGADFVNNGSLSVVDGGISDINGSIFNAGQLSASYLVTGSDTTLASFAKGAAYSITNSGIITSSSSLIAFANTDVFFFGGSRKPAPGNDSVGSVINTGTLQLGAGAPLVLAAYSNVNLGGRVQVGGKTLSASNPLGLLWVWASDYGDTNNSDASSFGNTAGSATISTDIVTSSSASISGSQVKLLANLSSVDSTGAPANTINIVAGPKSASDYAVRVATGKTVTAANISVGGDTDGDAPNVIVQGTLAASGIFFGSNAPAGGFFFDSNSPVSDVFTGPAGRLSMLGQAPTLEFDFTGSLKTVAYNNDPNNFRLNGLQVDSAGPLTLSLNPVAYTTNGTSNGLSAVNILVNSDVTLLTPDNTSVASGRSAVTGVTNIPNTHLVLQSSGNITLGGTGNGATVGAANFYWPGYVYLGTVSADAKGNALAGTLGLGTITTLGIFNNVLPGDIAGASGVHFITQFPLTLNGEVVTNANALVSFGTDLLNQAYASGTLKGNFFGGVKGSGTVVNYDKLDSSLFATQAPVATR